MDYTYEILPRPFELGGGWRLRLLEDSGEVGGGVFPPMDEFDDAQEALQSAYEDAQREAHAWLNSREKTDIDSHVQERRRRQAAVDFALANIGLSGFAPSEDARDQMHRFIDGKIGLDEFVNAWCIPLKKAV